jgi:hypothetical protein
MQRLFVFPHGLEPRLSEPESEVLPLHHRKITKLDFDIRNGANITQIAHHVKLF